MNILLAGANGQTGKILAERLVKSGYQVKGAIRKPEQVDGIRQIGAEPVVMDLTQPETFPQNLDGVDAVIFAAGSGGSAVEAVDRDGAISLIDAAKHANVGRFVMLSSIMVDTPEKGPEGLRDYLKAKRDADNHLKASGLDYAIVRPVALTDETPTGQVNLTDIDYQSASISRADVAHVLQAALERPEARQVTFEVESGSHLIDEVLREKLAA